MSLFFLFALAEMCMPDANAQPVIDAAGTAFARGPKPRRIPGVSPRPNRLLQGSSKDTFCPFETWLFQHQNKGKPPFTSCNVQVYNVRISVLDLWETHAVQRVPFAPGCVEQPKR